MTQPHPVDNNAIAGSQPGTSSLPEIQNSVSLRVDTSKSLYSVANDIVRSAEWHLNTLSDNNGSVKYAVDPAVSFYGNGSLSLIPRLGQLLFSSLTNEPTRSSLKVSDQDSSFYSSMGSTTLGSLNIDTVDGYVLNPLCSIFPSTNFSPTKPWIQKLFPSFSTNTLVRIAILELIQVALLKILAPKPVSGESKQSKVDIATIFVDNSELEDQLFNQL